MPTRSGTQFAGSGPSNRSAVLASASTSFMGWLPSYRYAQLASVAPFEPGTWHEAHQHMLEPAIHNDFLAVHECRTVACQEQYRLCHILRRADPPQWDRRRSAL